MKHGWTLKKQDWDHLRKILSETCWSKTKFDQLYRDSIPKSPGVYAICSRIPDFNQPLFKDLYNIIYTGKSKSLYRRFLEHCHQPKREIKMARQCFGDSLEYWYTVEDPNRIDELEACLIECFGPPANRRGRQIILGKIGRARPA